MRGKRSLLIGPAVLLSSAVSAQESPTPVSPARAGATAAVESRCPTFSWAAVDRARGYELAVYRVGEPEVEAEPTLLRAFPAGVTSWTPTLDACLTRGERYAWSVRATLGKRSSAWSDPTLFEIVVHLVERELEEALQLVRGIRGRGSVSERREASPAGSSGGIVTEGGLSSGTFAMVIDGDLQLLTDDTPRVRLEQTGGVFPEQIWDLRANELGFSVRNVTGDFPALTVSAAGTLSGDGSGLSGVTAADLVCSGCVGSGDLATGSVNGSKIPSNALTGSHILNGSLSGLDIGSNSLTGAQIGPSSIDSDEVVDDSLTSSDIGPGAILGAELGTIYAVTVNCTGGTSHNGCGDSTLGQICDTALASSRPIAVGCRLPQAFSSVTACGGDNDCVPETLQRTDPLSNYCRRGSPEWDATVSCVAP